MILIQIVANQWQGFCISMFLRENKIPLNAFISALKGFLFFHITQIITRTVIGLVKRIASNR